MDEFNRRVTFFIVVWRTLDISFECPGYTAVHWSGVSERPCCQKQTGCDMFLCRFITKQAAGSLLCHSCKQDKESTSMRAGRTEAKGSFGLNANMLTFNREKFTSVHHLTLVC